jgi:proteasome lid subunit RPN8/RPN11
MSALLGSDLPRLLLAGEVRAALTVIAQAQRGVREACGLLGGTRGADGALLAEAVHPLPNVSKLPGCFAIEITNLVQSRLEMAAAGEMPVAIYHTHPSGNLAPSLADLRLPSIIGMPSLIVVKRGSGIQTACHAGDRRVGPGHHNSEEAG